MNNNKATESQKKLLMVLLMAVVFFAAYRFVYQPLVDETDALVAENRDLEDEISDFGQTNIDRAPKAVPSAFPFLPAR